MNAGSTVPPLLVLGAMTALGSLGTQMFLPGLPAAAAELGVGSATIQLTISIYLFGLGVGQLGWGPVSDKVGGRPVLLIGIGLFALGCAVAAIAPNAPVLLLCRLVQAIGGSAALIVCRAMVADTSEPAQVVSRLAALSSITLISPTVAPTLGGLIVLWCGWRAIFVILAILAAGGWLYLKLRTVRAQRPQPPASGRSLGTEYLALLSHRRFQLFTLGNALTSSSLYIFLGLSPFLLLQTYHLTAPGVGLCYFAIAAAIILGTICVRRLERLNQAALFRIALLCMAAAALWLLVDAVVGGGALVLFLAPVALFAFGSGISGPAALGGALQVGATTRGSASSIFGATQMLISGGISALVAPLASGRMAVALPLALAISILLAVATLAAASGGNARATA